MVLAKVWVLVEVGDGKPTTSSLELLTAARQFADLTEVLVADASGADHAAVLGSYGAKKVFSIGSLEGSLPGAKVASAIAKTIESNGAPDAIFFAASYDGRDAAARLSAKLGLSVITNVVNLVAVGSELHAEHAIFGGEQVLTTRFTSGAPHIFVIRAKSFVAEESGGTPATVEKVEPGELGRTDDSRVVASHAEERTGPKLDEAAVVVSGGRGLGQPEKYEMIESLAKLLHGAPGASRAIVDAGWVPYAYQVGQTGKTVKPNLYLAVGISGATQHMVGMKGSKNIVAINKDREAPIFQICDFGIVGDASKVVPQLIEILQAR